MTRIKICGLMSAADALAAVEAGAHALGFVFASSPRHVSPGTAREIIRGLPPFVTTVGVFVDRPAEEVEDIMRECGLDLVQFHGRESPTYCAGFQGRAVKAISMDQGIDADALAAFRPVTRALLLDSGRGGTGRTFNWRTLPVGLDRDRLILAGGLTPDNVGTAIKTVRPWAVDVSSGVETVLGRKDINKVKAFIAQVREADHDLG